MKPKHCLKTTEQTAGERPPTSARRAATWLVGYGMLLVLLTHWPNPWPETGEPSSLDKVIHFLLYAGAAFLATRVLTVRRARLPTVVQLAVVFAVISAFGLLDEWTQPYTRRDFEWFDWLADILGAASGIATYCVFRRIRLCRTSQL